MDKNGGIIGALVREFAPPFVLLCASVAVFAYLVSKGKKRLGTEVGIAGAAAAIMWLTVNIVT